MTFTYRSVDIRPMDLLNRSWDLIRDQYIIFLGITFLAWLIGTNVPLYLLLGPMACGCYYAYLRKLRGETPELGDLFKGFDWFADSLIVSLIILFISLFIGIIGTILFFLVGFAGMATLSEEMAGFGLMGILIVLVPVIMLISALITVPFFFAFPLISDRGLKAGDAMKLSLDAVRANLIGILVLMLVIAIIHLLASLLCFIPIFLVMPVTFGAVAILYHDVFPDTE